MHVIRLSVRELVEYVLRSGSIDSTFRGSQAMQEGIKVHQMVQSEGGENYEKEVSLKGEIEYKDFIFKIEGRCDGLIKEEGRVKIDEIKSTAKELIFIEEDFNIVHWAQAKVYGYIYSRDNNLPEIDIQLTYVNTQTYSEKRFVKTFKFEELKDFIDEILEMYIAMASLKVKMDTVRDESIKTLEFPFENYRRGQRELAVRVYKAIQTKKRLFAKAPTGIGKTVSTIFPAVKALEQGLGEKIIYLTAKTITRTVAEETFNILRKKGLKIKTVTITAKEKICFNEEVSCNKENCIYADGYYDRVNEAIMDILDNEDNLNRDTIENYAKKYRICPFEFSLDLSMFVHCIICDYNYVFDPRVSLKRYDESDYDGYIVLIDEAHNLVDRSREMFSTSLQKRKITDLKKIFKKKDKKIIKALDMLNKELLAFKNDSDEGYSVYEEKPKNLFALCTIFMKDVEEWLSNNQKVEGHKELLELFFDVNSFIRIGRFYDERYVTYVERTRTDCTIKLFCLDPSKLLNKISESHRATIYFSGTLLPLDYYRETLGGIEEDMLLSLNSPYDPKNLDIFVYNLSTRYRHRESSMKYICSSIKELIKWREGNYMVFFPSYKYMEDTFNEFTQNHKDIEVIMQKTDMTEVEREDFLKLFSEENEKTLVGFCVLGGIFSEGIDLKGDRLNGAIVVGVGLPQICAERDILKEYYDKRDKDGYDYSYVFPGINKVMQAGGRVIRTETDKGTLLLIDDRFLSNKYLELIPLEWRGFKIIN